MTDASEVCEECTLKNIELNAASTPPACSLRYSTLRWGHHEDISSMIETNPPFTLVLGSEVAYSVEALPPLFETVSQFLHRTPNSKFIMSHTARFELVERELQPVAEAHGLKITYQAPFDQESILDVWKPQGSVDDVDFDGYFIYVFESL